MSHAELVEAVKGHLGRFSFWPSYILRDIFTDRPSPRATVRLKKVIAFFFGNDVPCELACDFYRACNGTASRSVAVSRFVGEQFHEWYCSWRRSRNKVHMAEYYNMRLRKHVYINGSLYGQNEPVLPETTVMDFGIDNTRCRLMIQGVLENVGGLEV
jgi:hypothetical protein